MNTNYEKFIVANQALMDCYKAVPADKYSAMSAKDQAEVCKPEVQAVRTHIEGGHAQFANILKERLQAFE